MNWKRYGRLLIRYTLLALFVHFTAIVYVDPTAPKWLGIIGGGAATFFVMLDDWTPS